MSELRVIRATPFHARAAASNLFNRWIARNGFTLAQDYGDPSSEAVTGRTNVIIADISWRWRVFVKGANAANCLSRMVTKDVNALVPGTSLKALWLSDNGAVRGVGLVAQYASDQFLLASTANDEAWLAEAARLFGVALHDGTEEEGGLALIGPYAQATLTAAGLAGDIAPLSFRKVFWHGLDVTVSRWGEQNGYEIWCKADDCLILWDRLMRSGAQFGIRPAGISACDILDIEAGVPRPHRDYRPAIDGFATAPSPASLGLESLIDERHVAFNGRAPWLSARNSAQTVLIGVEIESEVPAPFTLLHSAGRMAGHTLTSVHSPFLRRAIALAQVDKSLAMPGSKFSLQLPLSLENHTGKIVAARAACLPFVSPAEG